MKILHTEASIGWGGQEMRILKESIGMRKKGHEIILAVQQKGGLVSQAKAEGFKVYEIDYKKKRGIFLLADLLRLLKKEKIDLVNTHSSIDAWFAGVAAKLLKTPVIRTRHLSTKIRKGLNSYLLYNKLADFVMTTCQEIVPTIQSQASLKKERISSVPTGIDVDKIIRHKEAHSSFRQTYKILDQDFLIGMVCFMRSWKGVDDFINAASLSQNIPGLKWVIIGGGHEKIYREQAKRLNLSNLIFTGHLANPYPAISSIDAFCLLSTAHEGVSQASLQASLFEKPLITTPTGGLKEVCIDKKTGFLVPPKSPKNVLEAALKLKNDPTLAKEMGKEAKKWVSEKFSSETMFSKIESIYEYLCKMFLD